MASNSRPRSGSSGSNKTQGRNNPRNAQRRVSPQMRSGAPASGMYSTSSSRRSSPQRTAPSPRPRPRSAQVTPRQSVTSVRIGDMDRIERAERARQARKKRRGPLIAAGVIVGLIVAAVIALAVLSRSSVFAIQDVDFVGADHLTKSEVSQLVSIPQGTTLLNVDVDGIKDSLLRDSWVQSVTVNRVFPGTLEIVITERKLGAIVEIPMGATQTIQSWAIAEDGTWLMAVPAQDSSIGQSLSPKIYEDAASVLHITDVPYGLTPEMGTRCSDANVNNALAIVAGMTTELAGQVTTVSATDEESTLLTLESGIEIAFGPAEDIREKERVCLKVIEEHPGVVYINVRTVDRVTWRAL